MSMRSTIVDAHDDAFAVLQVGHFDHRAQGESSVCGGQGVLVVLLAAGQRPSHQLVAVKDSRAGFLFRRRARSGFIGLGGFLLG
jgi:hypothetical protein